MIALAILKDNRPTPVFPRWLAYVCIWCGVLMAPAGLCVFFKDGPLAWNGVITWWLLLVAFGVWVLATSFALLHDAIPHEEAEQRANGVEMAPTRVGASAHPR